MSWPHGPPQVQSDGFGELATTLKQGKGHGQGNKANERFPLYIVNIPLDVGEEQLIEMFSQAGEVTHAKCLPPKEGRNSCVGFITYGSKAEAEKAISKFHNAQIGNQTLRVDYTKSFKEGQTLRSGKPESSFSSESNQTGKAPFFCFNGLQQQQSPFGTNPQDNQASNVHSIGRGIHYDDHNAGNQLSSVGRGIHTKLAKTLMNGDNQTPFNQGTSQPGMKGDFSSGTNNFHNPGLQETQLALNGPYVTSSTSMLGAPSVENYNYQNNQQDILSNADDSQVHPSLALEGDHYGSQVNEMVNGISGMHVSQHVDNQQFGTNQISGPNQPFGASQPFRENESFTTNQSYSSGNQPFGTSQSFCENQSFGSNQPYDQSQSSAAGQPFGTNQPLGTNQPFGSTNQSFGGSQSPSTNQTFGSASRSFSGNQIFGENQYQVSGRLPRSQTGSGDKTCRKCGEPGHFARECPNISAGGGGGGNRGNYHQRGQPGHFSRECANGSNRGRGCDKSGEEGPFARECPKSNEDGRGIRPPPVNYVPPPLPDDVDLLFKAAVHKGINFDRFDNIPVEVTGNNPPPAIQTFDELLLPDMLKSNLGRAEFTKPTPVQKHGIPIILNGRDVMACAQTGSGKTVAFLLPVMAGMVNSRLPEASYLSGEAASPAALCIAPTRELAFQIYTEALKFSSGTYLRPVVCYGGVSVQHQLQKLERGCHILIGTPGRLIDFVGKNRVSLTNVRYLILDEADRMLDMGFENDIRKIVGQFGMPDKTQRQTLMFSATFPDEIQKMAGEFLNDYLFLAVGSVGGSNLDIKQHVLDVQGDQKRSSLVDILGQSGTDKTLVFVERKRNADFLASWLSQNQYPATSISGDRTQMEREDALRDFRNGRAPILIATSVAARGLDIPDVKHVVNYDLPQQIEDYVHRIGRTGRIGNQGRATAFFERGKDDKLARSLVKVLSDALQDVPSWLEETAERALGTSYGPAGGKFASRDTRQFGSRRSDGGSGGGGGKSGGGYMSGNNSNSEPPQTTNVSFTNQSSNIQSGDDEEEWD